MSAARAAGRVALSLALVACSNDYDDIFLSGDPAGSGTGPGASASSGDAASSAAAAGSGAGSVGGAGGSAASTGGAGSATGGAGGAAGGAGGGPIATGGTGGGGEGGTGPVGCTGFGEMPGFADGSCYQYVDIALGWGAARFACNLWGGDLVVMETESEWSYVDGQQLIGDDFWIGLRARLVTGYAYLWVDGSDPSWSLPWNGSSGGDGFDEPNVKVIGGFQAMDGGGQADHGYLCEKGP